MTKRVLLILSMVLTFAAEPAWADVVARGNSPAIRSAPLQPVVFEPGLKDHEFISHGAKYSLRLTSAGIDIAAAGAMPLRLTLAGAKTVNPAPEDLKTSQSHYYLGQDPKQWRIGVANYGMIRYREVYPGVDLLFYGSGKQWEYDFIVAPGADPKRIRMRLEGSGKLKINASGDLVLGDGTFQQHRPRLRQGGEEIKGSFRLNPDHTVSFEVAAYDHSRPLVIDPVIVYTSFLGGNARDIPNAVTVDKSGNVLVAGQTNSTNFPGSGPGQGPAGHHEFAFVSKFAPISGGKMQLLFSFFLGDSSSPESSAANAVATDAAGNIILAGITGAAHFPVVNAIQPQISGGPADCSVVSGGARVHCLDNFLAKLTPDGRGILFSTYYGGTGNNRFQDVALDALGNIYAVGYAEGPTDLKGTPNAVRVSAPSTGEDIHLVRFDSTGKVLYATYLGGAADDSAATLAVEKPGVVWIAGRTASKDFPLTANAYLSVFNAYVWSGFVARIDMNQSGAAGLTYSTYFHGQPVNGAAFGNTSIARLLLDQSGQVVFCGATLSYLAITPNALQDFGGLPSSRFTSQEYAAGDGFIARINPALKGAGSATYVSFVGGSDSDQISSCTVDSAGNFLVAGSTFSASPFLIQGSPIPFKSLGVGTNVFALRLDPTKLGGLVDTILFGGIAGDGVQAMALDRDGYAYIVGATTSKQFPVTGGAVQPVYGGDLAGADPGGCCGDGWMTQLDLNTPQVAPAALVLHQGDFQFGSPGTVLASGIGVHLADAKGNQLRLAGYPVTFTANGVTVGPTSALTDGDGVAGTLVQVGGLDGTVVASIPSLSSIAPYTFHFKSITGTLPASVAIVSGDKQSGKPATALAQPLVVELRDASNARLLLGGITVTFNATNATVSAVNVVTDSQGRASTQVTLGVQATAPSVKVVVGSLPAVTANFTLTGPAISAPGVTSAATFVSGAVSPGLIATFFGANIGPAAAAVSSVGTDGKLPTTLAQTRVLFDGVAAPLIFVSSGQINLIVPYGVAGKTTTQAAVEYQGVASNPITLQVVEAQPGLVSAKSSGRGQGAILNEDNSLNSSANPARRQHIVVLFGTGEGATEPAGVDGLVATSVYPKPKLPVKVKINGFDAEVIYAGAAPTLVAGVLQINVRIPAGVLDGDATVQVFVGNNQSPATVTVAVRGD
jgi:uncharacterized protein (TIGR03437 family)